MLDSTASSRDPTGNVDFDLGGEPATMSEVGTKLDLARAYMDMGDPEGARSILDEVLQEGSADAEAGSRAADRQPALTGGWPRLALGIEYDGSALRRLAVPVARAQRAGRAAARAVARSRTTRSS